MRIMIHSNGPMMYSGYGVQTKMLMLGLRDQGHEVACSAFAGLSGSSIMWDGFQIFPAGVLDFSPDVVTEHALNFKADVLITLMDTWKLNPVARRLGDVPFHVVPWMPIDCCPLSKLESQVLAAMPGCSPVAMSRFGQRQLKNAGFESTYIPHMVDTSVFKPLGNREEFRKEIGVEGKFVIGIAAANQDAVRKAWPEQFAAFAKFNLKHPDSILMVHTIVDHPRGHQLATMASDMGILDSVLFTDQYAQIAGLFSPAMMSDWYNALDVLSLCSYAEGFGIPLIEAQAAGTPVITTNFSATTEVGGPAAILVKDTAFWNHVHRANWVRPDIDSIARAYQQAYTERNKPAGEKRRNDARFHAGRYDKDTVMDHYWKPFLDALAVTPKPTEETDDE